jgi:hypothetical protein
MNPDLHVLPTSLNTLEMAILVQGGWWRGGETATLCDIMVTIFTVSRPGFKKQNMIGEKGQYFNGVWQLFCDRRKDLRGPWDFPIKDH